MCALSVRNGLGAILLLSSVVCVGTAHAELVINPYPKASTPSALARPPEVVRTQDLKSFDIDAYYARFKKPAPGAVAAVTAAEVSEVPRSHVDPAPAPYEYEKEIDIAVYYGRYGGGLDTADRYESIAPSAPSSQNQAEESAPTKLYSYVGSSGWSALQGESVKEVLAGWSARGGVVLIWDTGADFFVREPVSVDAGYEDAVALLFAQYMDSPLRPVGSLHIDPENGQRILVVQDTGQ